MTVAPEKIAEILEAHRKFLSGDIEANLRNADLRGADLYEANLRLADLRNANLNRADLRGANLNRANLRNADLRNADLYGANLYGADLREADLQGAYLNWADLREADLRGANLREAELYGANLNGAKLPNFQLCPESGSFVGWKKAANSEGRRIVLKLLIFSDSARTSTLVGRKCRAENVQVEGIYDLFGNITTDTVAFSMHDPSFTYTVNEAVSVKDFDADVRIECTRGIHFFMTLREAEDYV